MKVEAALWFESPGAMCENRTYPSIQAVKEDFAEMLDTYNRYGGGKPVGAIYAYGSTDYPIYTIDIGPRGGIVLGAT